MGLNKWCLPWCLVVVMNALSGCADERPETLILSAKSYLEKNDSKAAVIQLKSALQKDSRSAEARYLLGRAFLETGNPVSAEVELQKAQELEYSDPALLPTLARSLLAQGKNQKLVDTFAATSISDPKASADLDTSLAMAFAGLGDGSAAQARVDSALNSVPNFVPALIVRARLKLHELDFETAAKLVDQVLAAEPSHLDALALKGDLLLFSKHDVEGALKTYRQALQVKKDVVSAHASIIDLLLAKNDLPGAKAQFVEMIKVLPAHPQTKLMQAQIAFLEKDYQGAKNIAQQLLLIAPGDIKVLALAASLELQAGSTLLAENHLIAAIRSAPRLPEPRKALARINLRSGEPAKAIDVLGPLIDRTDADPASLSLAGQAYLMMGDAKKANTYLSRATKLDPGDIRSRTILAVSEMSNGPADPGVAELQRLAASEKSIMPDLALAASQMRDRAFDSALKTIDGLEKKQPDKPMASFLRGQVQVAQKNFDGARQSFERALSIDPQYFPAASQLASLDAQSNQPERAVERYRSLLKTDPKNTRAILAIADVRARTGAPKEEIVKVIGEAVRAAPGVAAPRLALVGYLLSAGQVKEALAAAQEAAAALPQNAEVVDALGRAQMAAGENDQAFRTYSKLAEQNPTSPVAHQRLATLQLATKNYDGARQSLQRALSISPNSIPTKRALISVELAGGRTKEAMALAKAVENEPGTDVQGSVLVGDVEASQKNWSAAVTAYRRAQKGGEANSELGIKLHAALMKGSRAAEAQKFATEWLGRYPRDAGFLQYLGDQSLAEPNLVKAEERYQAVLKLQPENAVVLNNLAWVTAKLKRGGALAYAQAANRLRPSNPSFMDTLSMVLAEEGQLANAVEVQRRAVALAPGNHSLRLNLAKLYIAQGDKSTARLELNELSKAGDRFSSHGEVDKLLKTL